jgi:hypothetical protein
VGCGSDALRWRLPPLNSDSPSCIARRLRHPCDKRDPDDGERHHCDVAKPTSTASRPAPEVRPPPFKELFKLLAFFRHRVFAVAHQSLLKVGGARHLDCSQTRELSNAQLRAGSGRTIAGFVAILSSDPAAPEPPTAEADAHGSWGRRQAVNYPGFLLWIDYQPYGGVHRAAPPLINSSPLPQHVDRSHSEGPPDAPRICR